MFFSWFESAGWKLARSIGFFLFVVHLAIEERLFSEANLPADAARKLGEFDEN